jgi:hypothetical protein
MAGKVYMGTYSSLGFFDPICPKPVEDIFLLK